ncbi:PREDICTED: adenosine kinase-like [Acropora digitifera]|uniref:adenosine kinase-like n=1 Tax=Acropora digitifera TaxID=70779 RepID=UPI00077B11AD|nr:PREDICTED: adenosine kinase-like [Acropora digitifera]
MAVEPEAKKIRVQLTEGIILGMGNPLLDISAAVDKDFLETYELEANNAILAEEKHKTIYKKMVEKFNVEYIPGGATQNSIRVAQWLLGSDTKSTSYIGCVGKDDFGKILAEKANEAGVHVNYLIHDEESTGTCAVCITGKHRSLVANLAAANCYKKSHLDQPENWAFVEKAKYIYIGVSLSGILLHMQSSCFGLQTFIMNLSAPFLCQFYKKQMMEAMPYVDILFGNETEARIFAKEQDFEVSAIKCLRYDHFTDGKVTEYPPVPIKEEEIVDTNGAGDAFVGGFLSQLAKGNSIAECVRCGHYAANYMIQQSGVTLNHSPNFS